MPSHDNPFTYYEIRPAVDNGEETRSFRGELGEHHTHEGALEEAEAYAETIEGGASVFWTIYGYDQGGFPTAIGDFTSFEAAYDVLGAILMPLRNALNMIENRRLCDALSYLEDICNQSTNEQRI